MAGLYTTRQAADMLGIDPGTVRLHIRNGTIKPKRVGRDYLLTQAHIDRLRKRRPPGRPASS
jgi:excisionase family DNA binding protein